MPDIAHVPKTQPVLDDPALNRQAGIEAASKDAVVEMLAGVVKQELSGLFQADLASAIDKARRQIDRRKLAVSPSSDFKVGRSGLPEMTPDQSAEYMRCAMLRQLGRPLAEPHAGLDEDGRITQALTSGTDSAGGYLVPDDFIAEVEKRVGQVVVIWPLLRKRPTSRLTVVKPEVTTYVT